MNPAQTRNLREIEQLQRKSVGIAHVSSKGAVVNRGDWTDDLLFEMVNKIRIPTFEASQEPIIIARFLEFYLSGNIRAKDQVCATVLDAIFLLRTVNGPVFTSEAQNAERWYTPNASVAAWSPDFVCHKFEGFEMPAFVDAATEAAYKALLGEPSATDGELFLQHITNSLSNFDDPEVAAGIRNLVSCLALITLRAVSKDSISVRNAFGKKQLRKNLSALINFDPALPLYPPAKSFVEKIIQAFANGSSATRNMFAVIVKTFIEEDDKSDEVLVIPALLGATVLTHTSRTGMGLVHLYSLAKESTGWSHDKLLTCTYVGATQQSWQRLADFLAKNEGRDRINQQHSWPWARIISDGHNRGLASKENLGLCVTFAQSAEHLTGKGIWTAEWSKNLGVHYDSFKKLGAAIVHASRVSDHELQEELHEDIQRYFRHARAHGLTGRYEEQLPGDALGSDGEASELDPAEFE